MRVLLLEAGPLDRKMEIRVPAAWTKLFRSEVDWNYSTEPGGGAAGRRIYWPRGKTLGGSSAINAMMWVRGHPSDFDAWAAAGCEGWAHVDVLPYFHRSEERQAVSDSATRAR